MFLLTKPHDSSCYSLALPFSSIHYYFTWGRCMWRHADRPSCLIGRQQQQRHCSSTGHHHGCYWKWGGMAIDFHMLIAASAQTRPSIQFLYLHFVQYEYPLYLYGRLDGLLEQVPRRRGGGQGIMELISGSAAMRFTANFVDGKQA